MNAMSDAIKARRAKPAMDDGAMKGPPAEGAEQAPDKCAEIMASLDEQSKAKLLEMLTAEMSEKQPDADDGPGVTDAQGDLKQSPAEQAELSEEDGESIMSALGKPDEGANEDSFMNKVRKSAGSMFKRKG